MAANPVRLDAWVKEIIVDPLSKEPLSLDKERGCLSSPYGRKYPIVGEIYDLRFLNNNTTKDQQEWKEGQRMFERWSERLSVRDKSQNYFAEIEGVRGVYEDIPIEGSCLDVGGHQGRLRCFLSPEQGYVTCDPFLTAFDQLDTQPNLIAAYPFLLDPVNFICCDAELLPFKSSSFQTVHMRSVIDHFLNPELALNEAYRVLKPDGALIVGSYVDGGKKGKIDFQIRAKECAKSVLIALGMTQYKDYHVWHPTYDELAGLISRCGFKIEKVHWQKGYNDMVCYLRGRKQSGLARLVE